MHRSLSAYQCHVGCPFDIFVNEFRGHESFISIIASIFLPSFVCYFFWHAIIVIYYWT